MKFTLDRINKMKRITNCEFRQGRRSLEPARCFPRGRGKLRRGGALPRDATCRVGKSGDVSPQSRFFR